MRQGLDRLMGWAIFAESDAVVRGDVDDSVMAHGAESDGSSGVGDEVEEGPAEGDDGPVGGETVHDAGHGVLADTVADVAAGVVPEIGRRWLEVYSVFGTG